MIKRLPSSARSSSSFPAEGKFDLHFLFFFTKLETFRFKLQQRRLHDKWRPRLFIQLADDNVNGTMINFKCSLLNLPFHPTPSRHRASAAPSSNDQHEGRVAASGKRPQK